MARIRSLKPEFWSSPNHRGLDPWARLLYMAMWNWADDHGRGTANPRELAGFVFPNDDHIDLDGFRRLLGEVRRAFGVVFYEVDGRPYFAIPTWERHQKIDKRSGARWPGPDEGVAFDPSPDTPSDLQVSGTRRESAEGSAEPAEDPSNTRRGLGAGTGEQGNRGTDISSTASRPRVGPKPGSDEDPDWCRFWEVWPKKVSKKTARERWAQAVKKTDAAVIIDAAERYRAHVERNQVSDDKIKHPDGWLNGERWNDELVSPVKSSPAAPTVSTPTGDFEWDDYARLQFDQWLPTPPPDLEGTEYTAWMREQQARFVAERQAVAR